MVFLTTVTTLHISSLHLLETRFHRYMSIVQQCMLKVMYTHHVLKFMKTIQSSNLSVEFVIICKIAHCHRGLLHVSCYNIHVLACVIFDITMKCFILAPLQHKRSIEGI